MYMYIHFIIDLTNEMQYVYKQVQYISEVY